MSVLYIIGFLFVLAIVIPFIVPNRKISDDPYDQKVD